MNEAVSHLSGAKRLMRVMASQSASTYANQVIAFVIPWLVLTRTGSAASAGLVAFAMAAAAFTGTLLGGLVTDRIGGRKVSIMADCLSLVTALGLAISLLFGYFSLWLVVVSQIVGVFFDGPGQIAKNTTLPAAAAEDNVPLVRAMGLQQTLQNVAMFVGPISAGWLVAVLTESVTLAVASGLFLLAMYLVAQLPRKIMTHEHPMTVGRAYRDMREAVDFIVKEPLLGPMQLFGPWYAFVVGPISTIVFPAWFVFAQQSSASLGTFLGVQAIGGMVGGFAFAALGPKVSQRLWLAGATGAYGLTLLSLAFIQPGSWWALVVAFVAGLVFTGLMAIPYTSFYVRTPERLLGRVNSLGAATGYLVIAVASLCFGWLITATSPSTALMVCAGLMLVLAGGVVVLPFMKYLDERPQP